MSLISDYLKDRIKTYREKLYDVQIEARTITSAPISGDAYKRTVTPDYTSINFYAQLAWGNRYGFSAAQEGGITQSSDVLVVTSMDNAGTLTTPKTYLVIEGNKYAINRIEKYQDSNEIVVQCDRMA